MNSNNFSGAFPLLPNRSMTQLRGLYLSDNQLTGSIIPTNTTIMNTTSICDQMNLQTLYIDNNRMNGTIPSCLNQLINVQQLIISNNQLSGTVPSELGTLERLSEYKRKG